MQGWSRIRKENRYVKPIEIKKGRSTLLVQPLYCNVGDRLTVVSENAGYWMVVVAVRNEKGELFSMRWEDIKFDKKTIVFEL